MFAITFFIKVKRFTDEYIKCGSKSRFPPPGICKRTRAILLYSFNYKSVKCAMLTKELNVDGLESSDELVCDVVDLVLSNRRGAILQV